MTIDEYIEQHISPASEVLQQIERRTNQLMVHPRMISGHVQGRVLSMLSKMIRPQVIYEFGTFTGYSALCLAEGLREYGQLYTFEKNDELEDIIKENLALSPLGEHIFLIIDDCLEWFRDPHKYYCMSTPADLVFIDADKREYSAYYDIVFEHVRKGGYIIADNTLWDGHVVDSEYDRDKQTQGLRQFNDKVAADKRVEKIILPLRDGLTICRKISE